MSSKREKPKWQTLDNFFTKAPVPSISTLRIIISIKLNYLVGNLKVWTSFQLPVKS
jgi:uncharacterized membrane protein YwzB